MQGLFAALAPTSDPPQLTTRRFSGEPSTRLICSILSM
jgi:hypothetical protein